MLTIQVNDKIITNKESIYKKDIDGDKKKLQDMKRILESMQFITASTYSDIDESIKEAIDFLNDMKI